MNERQQRFTLIYALHSGLLYGTERMALYTAAGLSDTFEAVFLAPGGPLLAAAKAQGFRTIAFSSRWELSSHIRVLLAENQSLAFLGTGVLHSALCLGWNTIYRRRIAHLQLVHGGACEKLSYGRKKLLNKRAVTFVAVSEYVRERLIANGVRQEQIKVIENFLPDSELSRALQRPPFAGEVPKRVIVISRLDPEKQVGLLIKALEQASDLSCLDVRIFGTGWEGQQLQQRASESRLGVIFEGFSSNIFAALAESDLLVHLCPVEPFGLVILEAFAAGVPALVPDTGGAASLVDDESAGFQFKAGSAVDLTRRLREILSMTSESLNAKVAEARHLLKTRFSASERIADYRALLLQELA